MTKVFAMPSVHYKFKSSLDYKTVMFEGIQISVGDLKKLIYENEKIGKSADFDLQITNAQTKQGKLFFFNFLVS